MEFDDPVASSPNAGGGNHRKERSAIAAQACETCRSRKSRCDEKRPKCSLCRRLDVDCRYREPLPTKKDKSIAQMMQQLNRMEMKLNVIGSSVVPGRDGFEASNSATPSASMTSPPSGVPQFTESILSHSRAASQPQSNIDLRPSYERSTSYQHLTNPRKMLLWPAINQFMLQSGIDTTETVNFLQQEGTAWFLRLELEKYSDSLPCDTTLLSRPVEPRQTLDGQPRVLFANLSNDRMSRLTDSYFDSYNVLYPLLDREHFETNVLPKIIHAGFGYGDFDSVLTLLVFALGQIAHDGKWAQPIVGGQGGARRSDVDRPPGLDIFNEARKRIGFVLTQTSVENIQMLQLTAVYYEACCRHLDFWRASVSASMAFQVLIKCNPIEKDAWNSPRGHQMRTVYWTCNLIENWYHMDLDLPRTGIECHEDQIPLPEQRNRDPQQEEIAAQFLAMIALRRVISRIHVTIFEAVNTTETPNDYSGPPIHVIKELSRHLDSWRSLLPRSLQWSDHHHYEPSTNAADSPVELGSSHLRFRYYYARFMIYRPFVYKALHFPDQMSEEDGQHTAECLQACMLWPIAMDPPRMRKRLIPYLFAWTQNFLGVLLILRMTTENRMLRSIAERHLSVKDVEKTVLLLLDWFRDMKLVDGMAEWSGNILSKLYGNVAVGRE